MQIKQFFALVVQLFLITNILNAGEYLPVDYFFPETHVRVVESKKPVIPPEVIYQRPIGPKPRVERPKIEPRKSEVSNKPKTEPKPSGPKPTARIGSGSSKGPTVLIDGSGKVTISSTGAPFFTPDENNFLSLGDLRSDPKNSDKVLSSFLNDANTMTTKQLANTYLTGSNVAGMTDEQKIGCLAVGVYEIAYEFGQDMSSSSFLDLQSTLETIYVENKTVMNSQAVINNFVSLVASHAQEIQVLGQQVAMQATSFQNASSNANLYSSEVIGQFYADYLTINDTVTKFVTKQNALESGNQLLQTVYSGSSASVTVETGINQATQKISASEKSAISAVIAAVQTLDECKIVPLLSQYSSEIAMGVLPTADITTLLTVDFSNQPIQGINESDLAFIQRIMTAMKNADNKINQLTKNAKGAATDLLNKGIDAATEQIIKGLEAGFDKALDAGLNFIKGKLEELLKKMFGKVLGAQIIFDCTDRIGILIGAQTKLKLMKNCLQIVQSNNQGPAASLGNSAFVNLIGQETGTIQQQVQNLGTGMEEDCSWANNLRTQVLLEINSFSGDITEVKKQNNYTSPDSVVKKIKEVLPHSTTTLKDFTTKGVNTVKNATLQHIQNTAVTPTIRKIVKKKAAA